MRRGLLAVAVVFAGGLLFLTLEVAVRTGPDVLTVFSALVLALLLFGVVGALVHDPEE